MTYCEGQFCHSLTRSAVIRFVTADYAVRASFKFLSKSIGFPRARVRHRIEFILSCEKLTDIGQISLCWKCKSSDILNKNESIYAMRVGKITRLKLVVTVRKYFIQLQARFSSRQEGTIIVDEIVTVVL